MRTQYQYGKVAVGVFYTTSASSGDENARIEVISAGSPNVICEIDEILDAIVADVNCQYLRG